MSSNRRSVHRRASLALAVALASTAARAPANALSGPFVHSNGAFVTGLGNGAGGADTSLMQSGFSTSGYSCSAASGARLADEFVVPAGEVWTLSELHWFVFQTGAPTSGTISGIQVNLWNSAPTTGGAPLWSSAANVLQSQVWSNCFRVVTLPGDSSRAIIDAVADLSSAPPLGEGVWWIDVQVAGSLASGPFAVPTVPHAFTDNARFFSAGGGWVEVRDLASSAQQDFPFVLEGTSVPSCGAAASYCTPGTSTHGCSAILSASGSFSASAASSFDVTCSGLEGQRAGLFFYGTSGALATPWGSGNSSFLCVKPPTQRTSARNSQGTLGACDGAFSLDLRAFLAANPGALGQPLAAGARFQVQAWYRDPPAPKTTQLSDALEIVVCP